MTKEKQHFMEGVAQLLQAIERESAMRGLGLQNIVTFDARFRVDETRLIEIDVSRMTGDRYFVSYRFLNEGGAGSVLATMVEEPEVLDDGISARVASRICDAVAGARKPKDTVEK